MIGKQVCPSFSTILDADGYSGIHIAAACRKNKVISYLIANGAKVNLPHKKSGDTALHFAVIYGNIDTAHLLLKFGADPNIVNNDGYSPLTCLAKQQPIKVFNYPNDVMKLQVYAWGTNANYNLGLAKQYSGGIPECIDIDIKENDDIVEICPNKYHTLFRSRKGKVYACGHGRGGRLGMNMQSSVIVPLKITFFKIKVLKMSAGVDHSVFLTENHQVWACGINSYMQLGFDPPPDYLCTPQSMKSWFSAHPEFSKDVIGVGAGAYHTVFWTPTSIVSFGLNGGQLGHLASAQSPFIIYPTIITSPRSLFMKIENSSADQIDLVFVGDAAILFSTLNGNLYIVSNYEIHCIIQFGRLYNKVIQKLCCIDGTLDTKDKSWNDKYLSHHQASPIIIVVLTTDSEFRIFFYNFSGRNFVLSNSWLLNNILDFCLNPSDIHFVTTSLQCCKLDLDKVKFYNDKIMKNLDLDINTFIQPSSLFTQLPYLCRPYSIFNDPQGLNFFALQYAGQTFAKNKPVVTYKSTYREDFQQLYDKLSDADENCDIVFRTKNRIFAAHSYIVSFHSNFLYDEILAKKSLVELDKKLVIEVKQIEQEVFECILHSLYTLCPKPVKYFTKNNCDSGQLLNTCQVQHSSSDETSNNEVSYLYSYRKTKKRKIKLKPTSFQQIVLNTTKELGFQNFIFKSNFLVMDPEKIDSENQRSSNFTFFRHKLSSLWDIWFQCKDVDELLGAHRCIVATRCPYFEIYFSTRWATCGHGSSDENIIQIHCSYASFKAILDYLYTDGDFHLKNLNVEVLCDVLVNSNLYLLPRLQEMCEVLISKRITLRNCMDLLQFCHSYSAENLLCFVQEFLTLNIQHFLTSRYFRECDDDYIKEFTEAYKQIIYKTDAVDILNSQEVPDEAGYYPFSNGHSITNCNSVFLAIDYKPFGIQRFWVDNYSENPSRSELQQGFSEDLSDFNENTEGWVVCSISPKQNKGKKTGSIRKRHRSTNAKAKMTETRARTTSQSSQVSTSSNSENDDHLDDQEQFTFDDLTERSDWEMKQTNEERWCVVGKRGSISVEEKLEELTLAHSEIDQFGSEDPDVSKCENSSMLLNLNCSSRTEKVALPSMEVIEASKLTAPISFPSLQEVMSMEVASKLGALQKGKSSKMPKMTSKKKKVNNGEQDNEVVLVISPSTPAWKGIGQVEDVNLADIIKNECEVMKKEQSPASKAEDLPRRTKNKVARKLRLEKESVKPNPSESPDLVRKGWNIQKEKCSDTICAFDSSSPSPIKIKEFDQSNAGSPGELSSSFQSIMKDEASKSNNLRRTLNKPLHLIQLEERAIEELLEFYGGAYNPDEYVTVTRVNNSVANPMWRKS